MNELNIDAESVTRNKSYDALNHLEHLLKIGWSQDSPVIKKFLISNNLTNQNVSSILENLKESEAKECCMDRNKNN